MKTHSPYAAPADAGFTVLEALVVITILALVAAIVMPAVLRPPERIRLQEAARELINTMRLTRSAAIIKAAPLTVIVDLDKRSVESPAVPKRGFDAQIEAQLKVAGPERLSPSRGGIRFFADGSSTGGEVILSLRGLETKVCVHWLTGQAREC